MQAVVNAKAKQQVQSDSLSTAMTCEEAQQVLRQRYEKRALIGHRVKVYFQEVRAWYEGCVSAYGEDGEEHEGCSVAGHHKVEYDDGDVYWEMLDKNSAWCGAARRLPEALWIGGPRGPTRHSGYSRRSYRPPPSRRTDSP